MTKYRTDAYEIDEKGLDRVVYVNLKNGNHITCVLLQLLNNEGKIEKFKYNEVLGVYEEL